MRFAAAIFLALLATACTGQAPDGRECNGQIPLITTRDGAALTTNTANCIAETKISDAELKARRDADVEAVHRQVKGMQP
ncbi:MAG: hypothetical protein FJX23_09735 [Alphaproteobacteria bacterium]|nr:hypothetical protein [Alphaproteobacteria bacterium]